jgi:hypothetical protein
MKWILVLLFAAAAPANGGTSCYTFEQETPSRDPRDAVRQERWCYQPAAEGALYIFNADGEEVRPELALLKNADGTVTHGSLLAGEISFHRVRGEEFNPFPVPLSIPHRKPGTEPLSARVVSSADNVLARLKESRPGLTELTVREGIQAAQARQPWRGFWWPYKKFPMAGPLSKYDRFVTARTGANPGAYGWERAHHVYKGVWWEGHCNGWAASSILRGEPSAPVTDAQTGLVFTVSDQKGILAEHDYCARATIYGKRYRGKGDDIWDMDAALFHNTLLYYIGGLGKPIAIDYHRDAPVDNHVVSGYGMQIVRTSPTSLSVTATLRVHKYDTKLNDVPGVAPAYTRIYKYVLRQDGNGRITSGRWLSRNPDFLWAPLGTAPCRRGGHELKEEHVQGILKM